jgi:transglutaminase-like putative cysteine protease
VIEVHWRRATGAVVVTLLAGTAKLASADHHEPHAREMTLRYEVEVQNADAAGKEVSMWLPVPPTTNEQEVRNLRVESELPYSIETESEFGNRLVRVHAEGTLPKTIRLSLAFDVTRRAVNRLENETRVAPESPDVLRRFLEPDRLVPVAGPVGEEARKVVGAEKDPLGKARVLYEHIVKSMTYDKSGEGWGRGDALYACDVRKGNCTDFHSLFIGLARASGLPARFVMGFSVPGDKPEGEIAGYHCWAEFYVEGRGWIPIDASEASKNPKRTDDLFGGLDADRVAFTTGRDLSLPNGPEEPVNFLIYPYVLVDGKAYNQVVRKVTFEEKASG